MAMTIIVSQIPIPIRAILSQLELNRLDNFFIIVEESPEGLSVLQCKYLGADRFVRTGKVNHKE